ncbi:hypothetical protein JCM11491_005312 [Sporobolomyces phaffii]
MAPTLHPSALPILTLIPLVVSLAPEQPQPHVGHLFARLLANMYAPPHALPTNWNQWRHSMASREPGVDDKCDVVLAQVERSCIELLRGGIDAIADWVHHDLEPLCSSEDDEPSAITHSPILRTSPLGVFVRKACLALERMDFERIGKCRDRRLIEDERPVRAPCVLPSEARSAPARARVLTASFETRPRPLSNAQALLSAALGHFHQANYDLLALSLEECFKISRSHGDLETLQGCWSLLQRIPKQHRIKLLHEWGRPSSESTDDPHAKGKGKVPSRDLVDLSNPHDLLFQVYESLARTDRTDSVSVSRLLTKLVVAQTLAVSCSARHGLSRPSGPRTASTSSSATAHAADATAKYEVDLETFAVESRFVQAELWQRLGEFDLPLSLPPLRTERSDTHRITPIAKVYQDLVLERARRPEGDPLAELERGSPSRTNCDLRLTTLLEQSRRVSDDEGAPLAALDLLLTSVDSGEKRRELGLARGATAAARRSGYARWKRRVVESLERDLSVTSAARDPERSHEHHEGLETVRALLGTSRTRTNPRAGVDVGHASPASRLSDALARLGTTRPGEAATAATIARAVDLARARLDVATCRSGRAEAARGARELAALEHCVLVFSSRAWSSSSPARADPDESSEPVGEMLAAREVEAEYWHARAELEIVASDYDVYRELALDEPTRAVSTALESLCTHLALSTSISAGEAGEWRRRAGRYYDGRSRRDGDSARVVVDWRRVLGVVELVETLVCE